MSAEFVGEALEQLERLLQSPGFARNPRLSRFLRFLVEQHLEGRDIELKESVIGTEVFGRDPDYNPKRDAIVRTEAGRLRARLTEYYANGGKRDALVIELPKGGYVPAIRRPDFQQDSRSALRLRLAASLAGLAILILAGYSYVNRSRVMPASAGRYRNSEAYGLYQRARSSYHPGREIPDDNVDLYQEAITKDATFAPAYAGLAAACAFASSRPMGLQDYDPVKMQATAEKAIQLDPSSAEARDAMGVVYARLGQWGAAQRSFRRALELDPKAVAVRLDFAMNLLLPLGWIGDALHEVRLAEKLDPRSPDVEQTYTYILIAASQFDQAEQHCQKSGSPAGCLGRIRLGQGRVDEAIPILAAAEDRQYLGYAYGRAGRRGEAERLAAVSPGRLQQVLIYAGLGDRDRTFQALDRMTDLGPVRVGRTLTFPELSFIRGDPRVATLRKKVGLPE